MDPNVQVITVTLAVGAVVYVLTNLIKDLRAGNWNGVVTTLASWGIAVFALWLISQTQWADDTPFLGKDLDTLSFPDLVILGLLVSGVAGTGWTVTKALDGTQSTQKATLLPESVATQEAIRTRKAARANKAA